VAALGWLFDCMDQRIFMVSRQAALTELLGYQDGPEGKLQTQAGETMTEAESTAASDAINWYSGLATAIFMIGWATGGLVFGIMAALLVVLVRRRLREPESWQQARAERLRHGDKLADMGNLSQLLHDPRWRYHTIIGVLLALAGVIGLWGVAFWTFELVRK